MTAPAPAIGVVLASGEAPAFQTGDTTLALSSLARAGLEDMTMPRRISPILNALAAACVLMLPPVQASAQDRSFEAENNAAMARMMTGMAIKPSGDVDRDFAQMMIAHHQGAIDMAQAELRHGGNEQLLRIAQEIIVDQQQEIAAMRLALGDPLPASAPAPTQPHRHDPACPAPESRR